MSNQTITCTIEVCAHSQRDLRVLISTLHSDLQLKEFHELGHIRFGDSTLEMKGVKFHTHLPEEKEDPDDLDIRWGIVSRPRRSSFEKTNPGETKPSSR